MVLRFTHIGICVADLDRALRFYRDGLGFLQVSELRIAGEPAATLLRLPDVDLHAVYLERNGMRIELLHFLVPGSSAATQLPPPLNRAGLSHLSFRVEDLEATLSHLQSVGAKVVDSSRIAVPAFDAAAVFICDPDGTLIELVQAPGDPSAPPGT